MTVLYTTHLMEEAQELSDRVGIIDYGEIIALGSQGELTQMVGEEDRLVFDVGEQTVDEEQLARIKHEITGISHVVYDPPGEAGEIKTNASGLIVVLAKRGRKALPDIIRLTQELDVDIQSVEVREPDLEAVFLNLTGRALRE
jgi:ABC-2 type transport system ATP-binding protein